MVVSTSNLVETVTARCTSRDTLSRSVGQLERTFSLSNAKINRKRPHIAEIACPITKLAAHAVLSADAGLLVVYD